MKPDVTGFFDETTSTVSYVVCDASTKACAIIDSVLNYDATSGRTTTKSADEIIGFVQSENLSVEWILETHIHADHLSCAPYLKTRLGGTVGIGENVSTVQRAFGEIFNAEEGFPTDGSQFDHLFADDEQFVIGSLMCRTMHTPGHTPACLTYVVGNTAFVGDTLFMPDYGTARADFPGGDAATLYRSIQKILDLPEDTRLYACHDYKPPDRKDYQWESTVAEQRAANVHLRDGVTEAEFVKFRDDRDTKLGAPKLILPSVQINMRAGMLPPPEENGTHYLKIPVDVL